MELVSLQQHLSDALGLRVDVIMKQSLKRGIGRRILAEAVML
jgi:predicted nucleotidyltransferase